MLVDREGGRKKSSGEKPFGAKEKKVEVGTRLPDQGSNRSGAWPVRPAMLSRRGCACLVGAAVRGDMRCAMCNGAAEARTNNQN